LIDDYGGGLVVVLMDSSYLDLSAHSPKAAFVQKKYGRRWR
jgi:hypothetical protein